MDVSRKYRITICPSEHLSPDLMKGISADLIECMHQDAEEIKTHIYRCPQRVDGKPTWIVLNTTLNSNISRPDVIEINVKVAFKGNYHPCAPGILDQGPFEIAKWIRAYMSHSRFSMVVTHEKVADSLGLIIHTLPPCPVPASLFLHL